MITSLTLFRKGELSSRLRLGALAVAAACSAVGSAQARYTVTDLGTLPGQSYSWVWQQSINDSGVVAVYANDAGDPDAFSGDESYLWLNGHVQSLPGLAGATDTIVFSLNNHGQSVGRSTQPGSPNAPVLWNGSSIRAPSELSGDNKGAALMINDLGKIVGYSANTGTGVRRAVTWSGGFVSPLPPVAGGGIYDEALGVNNRGDVVGWSGADSGLEHIALWSGGSVTDLGTLGGDWGDGYAINIAGQVVGQSATATGQPDAFLWQNGTLFDLGTLEGDSFSIALGLNDRGQVAGFSAGDPDDLTTYRAVLWQNGGIVDLQTKVSRDSGWTLLTAGGINNRGQIEGFGIHNGQVRAFVMTPSNSFPTL